MRDEVVPTQGMLIHARKDWPCTLCRPHAWAGLGDTLLCMECATALVADAMGKMRASSGAEVDFKGKASGSGGGPGGNKGWIPPDRDDR